MHDVNDRYPLRTVIWSAVIPYFAKSEIRNCPPASSDSTPMNAAGTPSFCAATNPVATGPPPAGLLLSARSLVSSVG